MQNFDRLVETVQRNCHVSDARYAGNYSMCTFLLKMREYYRWERGFAPGVSLPHEEVGEWLQERERLWQEIENEGFSPVAIDDRHLDPFDSHSINQLLVPESLVYSGGYGRFSKPLFFLGCLQSEETIRGFRVLVTDNEYARDLSAPPAMTQGRTIYVRRAAIRQMIWESYESWRWRRKEGALERALADYGFEEDAEAALERMTDAVLALVKEHEVGEALAGELLGPDWEELVMAVAATRGEVLARALRDHLADSLATLPRLLAEGESSLWHYYAANLTGMRQALLPAFMPAYESWLASGGDEALAALARRARGHWEQRALALLERFRAEPRELIVELQKLPEADLALA